MYKKGTKNNKVILIRMGLSGESLTKHFVLAFSGSSVGFDAYKMERH